VDTAALRAARILIVDDEEANVVLLEQMLSREGYVNVASTTDSSQVVGLCLAAPPDLVLLDLVMPSPDGFEVMEELRGAVKQSWFPILVLTADASQETKQRALAGGAKDFLTKPLERIEVLLRIENLIEVRLLQRKLEEQNLALARALRERS
jgi:PleD family two-component response regulator